MWQVCGPWEDSTSLTWRASGWWALERSPKHLIKRRLMASGGEVLLANFAPTTPQVLLTQPWETFVDFWRFQISLKASLPNL